MCALAAALAVRVVPNKVRGRKPPSAALAPEFRILAWEIRAAMARACKRELYVKRWEELTPIEGTPGLRVGDVDPSWQRSASRK
jgi:hypothetical protein